VLEESRGELRARSLPVVVGVWQHQPLYLPRPIVETRDQARARQPAAEFIFAIPEPGPALNELGGDRAGASPYADAGTSSSVTTVSPPPRRATKALPLRIGRLT
jgi:hypothetical protein